MLWIPSQPNITPSEYYPIFIQQHCYRADGPLQDLSWQKETQVKIILVLFLVLRHTSGCHLGTDFPTLTPQYFTGATRFLFLVWALCPAALMLAPAWHHPPCPCPCLSH